MKGSQNLEESRSRHATPSSLIHELRSPLNQIIGYSEMLSEQAKEAGLVEMAPDLQRIQDAGKQLLSIISDNFYPVPSLEKAATNDSHLYQGAEVGLNTSDASDLEPPLDVEPRSVLVVDDIEANRDVLTRRLTRLGHTVSIAENGKQALDMLAAGAFDLILLDIMMPVMDGYEVLRRLKADQRLKHIPVVMITALSELDSAALCIEMGAEDYLTKPFNRTLLQARIGACLEKKKAHDREADLFEQLQHHYKLLQELEAQRDSLTHMIVHDLRTPLTSVIAGMQTLNVVGPLNDAQREVIDISVHGGRTLLGMINDLLDVEKLESGSMQLECGDVTATELVSTAVDQVVSLAQDKHIMLVQHIDASLTLLQVDESKLTRTLVNLLGNAIKFTPTGGTITIEASRSEDVGAILFSVSDTGEGIPAEAFGRIFEKFGQVESRKAGRTMSTGLGLTFCKLAVEAHGGKIGVESKPGVGSKFWFTIPLA